MHEHNVTLLFQDGNGLHLNAQEEETLYAAALRQNIRLEVDCLEGVCATCRAICSIGDYKLREHSEEALSPGDKAGGHVLACQTLVRSDCVFELPYASSLVMREGPGKALPCRILNTQMVSPGILRLDVGIDGNRSLAFLPGQYAQVGIPGSGISRAFSFANPPNRDGPCTFFIKLIEGGAMSDYLARRARNGDALQLTGPLGHFYLRALKRPVLMLAGGTGLAPMLSMLDELKSGQEHPFPVHLIHGASNAKDLFALPELDALAGAGINFTYECVSMEASPGWSGAVGHLTSRLQPEMAHAGNCDAYLCGPPGMIEAGTNWLLSAGVAKAAIHAERFVSS